MQLRVCVWGGGQGPRPSLEFITAERARLGLGTLRKKTNKQLLISPESWLYTDKDIYTVLQCRNICHLYHIYFLFKIAGRYYY